LVWLAGRLWPELQNRRAGYDDNNKDGNNTQDYWCGVTPPGWNDGHRSFKGRLALFPTYFRPSANGRARPQNGFFGHCLTTTGGSLSDTTLLLLWWWLGESSGWVDHLLCLRFEG
jgi:hypothetical protein